MSYAFKLLNDDCINILKELPTNSIDSMVTDPPAGISFRGLDWDGDRGGRSQWIKWMQETMTECHRILKPGAYGFVWALPRTSHWTATALENSGFRIKDVITHVFASGFPKSMYLENLIRHSKRTDPERVQEVTKWMRKRKKALNTTNAEIDSFVGGTGLAAHWTGRPFNPQAQIPTKQKWPLVKELFGEPTAHIEKVVLQHQNREVSGTFKNKMNIEAHKWKGWGTALRPASEHWILIQKNPEERGTACNLIKYGTGGINIDASRIRTHETIPSTLNRPLSSTSFFGGKTQKTDKLYSYQPHEAGRYPSNFLVTLEKKLEQIKNLSKDTEKRPQKYFKSFRAKACYSPKASRSERGDGNSHPTVKPVKLIQYLAKMVTPDRGTLIDPFMGSGTTGVAALRENFQFIGIEIDPQYFSTAKGRIHGFVNNKKG